MSFKGIFLFNTCHQKPDITQTPESHSEPHQRAQGELCQVQGVHTEGRGKEKLIQAQGAHFPSVLLQSQVNSCYFQPPVHPSPQNKSERGTFLVSLPAHGLGGWPSSRGLALLEDVVAQQGLGGRSAEGTHHFQLRPGSVHEQLLGLLRVSVGRVEENQSVARQDGAAHLTSVGAAVACIALVQLAVGNKSRHTGLTCSLTQLQLTAR